MISVMSLNILNSYYMLMTLRSFAELKLLRVVYLQHDFDSLNSWSNTLTNYTSTSQNAMLFILIVEGIFFLSITL